MSALRATRSVPTRAAALVLCLLQAACASDTISVADGFNLWVGKTLAHLALVAIIFGVPAVLLGLLSLSAWVGRRLRRGRQ